MNLLQKTFGTAALSLVCFATAHALTPEVSPMIYTDAQITQIIVTTNDAEISQGQLAVARSAKPAVTEFAGRVIADHAKNAVDERALEMKASLKPEETDASVSLKQKADASLEMLKNAKAEDFDKAYIAEQVKMSQDLLAELDNNLIPKSQNADLKAFLQSVRMSVQSELNDALKIQSSL